MTPMHIPIPWTVHSAQGSLMPQEKQPPLLASPDLVSDLLLFSLPHRPVGGAKALKKINFKNYTCSTFETSLEMPLEA